MKSLVFAFQGWKAFAREQRNLGIQVVMALLTIAAGFFFGITGMEWCAILLCIAMVLGLEMVNTAMENLVNLVTKEQHPLAGKVKDIAAGAVAFASLISVVVGVIVFWKYVVEIIERVN